jgi:hypothetical protein
MRNDSLTQKADELVHLVSKITKNFPIVRCNILGSFSS